MARTAALPRVEGLAPQVATRGATPSTVHLRRPVADPRAGHGDRRTTFSGPSDAPPSACPRSVTPAPPGPVSGASTRPAGWPSWG